MTVILKLIDVKVARPFCLENYGKKIDLENVFNNFPNNGGANFTSLTFKIVIYPINIYDLRRENWAKVMYLVKTASIWNEYVCG